MLTLIKRALLLMRLNALQIRIRYLHHRAATLPRELDVCEAESRVVAEKIAYLDFVESDIDRRIAEARAEAGVNTTTTA